MFIRPLLILLLLVFAIGCNKANPEAYKSDPILQDYREQMAATTAAVESLKKQIDGIKKDIKGSLPQTGQAKVHTQKYYEMEGRLRSLEQQLRFWKIRIQTRSFEAQKEYLEAHNNKESWPNAEKVESYFTAKRLRQAKIKWDAKSSPKPAQGHEKQASSGH